MNQDDQDPTVALLQQVRIGDRAAIDQVLNLYRPQLKRVVVTRLDARLAARLDASDVVQDVCTSAYPSLAEWVQDGKPLYACLYRLTRDHLARLRRDHVVAQRRSVTREVNDYAELSDGSLVTLCRRLAGGGETPSRVVARRESQALVRRALSQLREVDREVLVMRILEGIPAKDVADILEMTEAAVNMRQLRALRRMRTLLESDS